MFLLLFMYTNTHKTHNSKLLLKFLFTDCYCKRFAQSLKTDNIYNIKMVGEQKFNINNIIIIVYLVSTQLCTSFAYILRRYRKIFEFVHTNWK